MGSFVAGVTVQKLFRQVLQLRKKYSVIGKDPDYIYSSELAENIRQAGYLKDTEIEIINKWKKIYKSSMPFLIMMELFQHCGKDGN